MTDGGCVGLITLWGSMSLRSCLSVKLWHLDCVCADVLSIYQGEHSWSETWMWDQRPRLIISTVARPFRPSDSFTFTFKQRRGCNYSSYLMYAEWIGLSDWVFWPCQEVELRSCLILFFLSLSLTNDFFFLAKGVQSCCMLHFCTANISA